MTIRPIAFTFSRRLPPSPVIFDLLGRRAVELLMQQMAAPTGSLRELLPARLVVRQSTWPLAAQDNTAPLIAELKALVEKL